MIREVYRYINGCEDSEKAAGQLLKRMIRIHRDVVDNNKPVSVKEVKHI